MKRYFLLFFFTSLVTSQIFSVNESKEKPFNFDQWARETYPKLESYINAIPPNYPLKDIKNFFSLYNEPKLQPLIDKLTQEIEKKQN